MRESTYSPPFSPTTKILKLSIRLGELIGKWDGATRPKPKVKLRKLNRIRSIQSSLEIEGNTLSLEQVTAILENKKVWGPAKDIQEVQNAIKAYQLLPSLNPKREKDFLKLHGILMQHLIPSAGKYRTGQVGVLKGSKVSHIAPPANRIPELMLQLFAWMRTDDIDAFIVSCIVHYEIEFIHPFTDGNGRMGRLWQSLILSKSSSLFEFVPVEEMIRHKQKAYYAALEKSDQAGNSSFFVEYMLECIVEALESTLISKNFETPSSQSRIESSREHFQLRKFTRSDYIRFIGNISTATASRDLKEGLEKKILTAFGKNRMTRYHF